MALNLYSHNQRALAELVDNLNTHGRCAIEMATGCGKSFVVFGYHEMHPNDRMLIVAPHNYITTDQMRKIKSVDPSYDMSCVTHMTYAKLMRDVDNGNVPRYLDCIVLDEIHHAGAPKWGEAVQRLIDANPKAKLIGTTATPVRNDGRNPVDALFGEAVTTPYTLLQAWNDSTLPVPTYVVGTYGLRDRFVKIGNEVKSVVDAERAGELKKLYEELRGRIADGAANVDALIARHITPLIEHPKVIVFCPDTHELKRTHAHIGEWFREDVSDMHVYVVNYRRGASANEASLRCFSEDDDEGVTRVLLAVDCVGEGIHVSDVDAVIMCRKTSSTQVYIQQMGRCLETHSGKAPIVLDLVDNLHMVGRPEFVRQYVRRTVMDLMHSGVWQERVRASVAQGKTREEAEKDIIDDVANRVGDRTTFGDIVNAAMQTDGAVDHNFADVDEYDNYADDLDEDAGCGEPTDGYARVDAAGGLPGDAPLTGDTTVHFSPDGRPIRDGLGQDYPRSAPNNRGAGRPHNPKPAYVPIFEVIDETVSARELLDRIEDALEKNRKAEALIRELAHDYMERVEAGIAPKPVDEWLDEYLDERFCTTTFA